MAPGSREPRRSAGRPAQPEAESMAQLTAAGLDRKRRPAQPEAESMASHTRSGRTGMSMLRTPRWARASTTAFT